jgi:membrane carboxypeptidase/penicillin-binding protein PbpC
MNLFEVRKAIVRRCYETRGHRTPGVRVLASRPAEAISHVGYTSPRLPTVSPGCRSVVRGGVPPSISSPARGLDYNLHAENRREIPFTAVTDADSRLVYWFVDNHLVGTSRPGEALFWKARPGNFIVRAVDDQGRSVAEDVNVTFSAH